MKFSVGLLLAFTNLLLFTIAGPVMGQDGVVTRPAKKPAATSSRSARRRRTASTSTPGRGTVVVAPVTGEPAKPSASAAESGSAGIELFGKKEYAAAEAKLREAVRLAPGNALYNYYLGGALFGQLKYAEAEVYFRKAIALNPANAVLRTDLAGDLFQQKKYPQAEEEIRAAIKLEPTVANYRNQLGNLLYHTRRFTEAEESYSEAVRLEPGNGVYQHNLKTLQALLKTPAKTVTPTEAALHNNRGNALFDQSKYKEAEAEFREAVRLEPTTLEYTNNVAKAMIRRQDLEAAAGSTSSNPEGIWAVFTIVNKTTGPTFYQLLLSGEWKEFVVLPGRQAIHIAAFENPLYIVFDSKYEVGNQIQQRQLAVTKVSGHAPTESDKRKSKVNTFALNGSGEIELTPTP